MKNLLKSWVVAVISWEAARVLKRHAPLVVGITGSVGKTSTKEVVAAVMSKKYTTRTSPKSFNSELGVPLTILGEDTAWGNPLGWLGIMWRGLLLAFFSRSYPEALVLEMGVDRPGDMAHLVRWVRLDAAIVTHIGDTPVHVEAFPSVRALVEEKLLILTAVKPGGVVVLDHDDPAVIGAREGLKHRVYSFGMSDGAMIKGGYYAIVYDAYGAARGFAAKILIESNAFPFAINGVIGRQFVYPALAAAAVGTAFDINMVDILSAIESVKPVPGRMRLFSGTAQSLVIDDTYNASPVAMREALGALADVRVRGRKIAILGDMRELGAFSQRAHREIGALCAKHIDELATVGSEARGMADGAREAGMTSVVSFDSADEALAWARSVLKEGDAILVKASQSVRLERVVEGLLADPRDAAKLVRQGSAWDKR